MLTSNPETGVIHFRIIDKVSACVCSTIDGQITKYRHVGEIFIFSPLTAPGFAKMTTVGAISDEIFRFSDCSISTFSVVTIITHLN